MSVKSAGFCGSVFAKKTEADSVETDKNKEENANDFDQVNMNKS